MIINHISIDWYVEKLMSGVPFSLTKHSDASLYCMQGKEGGDCNGCIYTPELRHGLLHSISYQGEGYYHGIQRLTDRDNAAFDRLLENHAIYGRVWIDTGIIPSQFVDGGLYPLIKTIQQLPRNNKVIVSNAWIAINASKLVNGLGISVPKSNTFEVVDVVIEDIGRHIEENGPSVFFFSCGMAACALIPILHAKYPGSSFIDVGHLWDALLGNKIRHYQTGLTQGHIDANFKPTR